LKVTTVKINPRLATIYIYEKTIESKLFTCIKIASTKTQIINPARLSLRKLLAIGSMVNSASKYKICSRKTSVKIES
jgi:hypothetical protein